MIPTPEGGEFDADFIETMLPHMTNSVDVVVPWVRVSGASWSPNRIYTAKAMTRTPPPVFAVRKKVWEQAGGFSDRFWWDLFQLGARVVTVPEVLFTYKAAA